MTQSGRLAFTSAEVLLESDRLNRWLTLGANVGVLAGLMFVGYEISQNTVQLRAESSHSITESVNAINTGIYADPALANLLMKGEQDLGALSAVERSQFNAYQFSRLNIAEYILDLEREGVSDLNFNYVEWVVSEFNTKPGLRTFIRELEDAYVGSEELLARLLGDPTEK